MEFATSLSTGRTYEAFKVNYAQARTLRLVCPVCKEKVFKRVRRIPHETHMFAHYKGGSPDCELYFPAATDVPSAASGFSVSRGQTFEQFIRDINADLRNLLIAAQIITERGIDARVLRLIAALVAKEARNLILSFKVVEATVTTVLGKSTQHIKARTLAPLIFEFYTRDGARFIDALLCQWALYCISFKDEKADIAVVLDDLILRQEMFSGLAGTMLAGLALHYSDEDLSCFDSVFLIQMESILTAGTNLNATSRRPGVTIAPEPFASSLPEMITLPRGKFLMGSPKGEDYSYDKSPQHRVHSPYALAVGKYPITFDQWDACVKDGGTRHKPADSGWGRGSRPVINVSWDDIQPYLRWLRKVTGKTYRLLSEAEWEYAARARRRTAYLYGSSKNKLDSYAWFSENSGNKTHPVGGKLPNGFGLYDMHGNVWEWTADCYNHRLMGILPASHYYSGAPTDGSAWTEGNCSQRVVRGGSWGNGRQILRAAARYGYSSSSRVDFCGFRVARTD